MAATPRNKALDRLDALSVQIAYHLFKLICCKDDEHHYQGGWLKELNAWRGELFILRKSKTKYGNYDVPLLMEHIFAHHMDDLTILTVLAQNDGLHVDPATFSALELVTEAFCESCVTGERFVYHKA